MEITIKKPEEVRILGITYPIEYIDIINTHGDNNAGLTINHKTKIVLDTANSTEFDKCTLLHEILEALDYRLEIKLEHHQISQIEGGLFQVMQDNPDLFRELCK